MKTLIIVSMALAIIVAVNAARFPVTRPGIPVDLELRTDDSEKSSFEMERQNPCPRAECEIQREMPMRSRRPE